MGTVIWFKRQDNRTGADDDRPYLYREAKSLDQWAERLGVPKLSGFFDFTDLKANLSDEDLGDDWAEQHEAWYDPTQLLTTLEALQAQLASPTGAPPVRSAVAAKILEEIDGCMVKAKSALEEKAKVHLCVVT